MGSIKETWDCLLNRLGSYSDKEFEDWHLNTEEFTENGRLKCGADTSDQDYCSFDNLHEEIGRRAQASEAAYVSYSLDSNDLKILNTSNINDKELHIKTFNFSGGQLLVKNAKIDNLRYDNSNNKGKLILQNCLIRKISFSNRSDGRLSIHNSQVGVLHLLNSGHTTRAKIEIVCSKIYTIDSHGVDYDFEGDIEFRKVEFETSKKKSKILNDIQGMRTFKSKLESLGNGEAASALRVALLRIARPNDDCVNKTVGWLYDIISVYGTRPSRAFISLFLIYVISVLAYWHGSGTTIGLEQDYYSTGWRTALISSDCGSLYRALIMPIQSMTYPLGVFGYRSLVIASNGWWQLAALIQGLLTFTVLLMLIFSIRKKFKLQW